MTEIITDYLDAKQLADRLTALELHSTSELARLEQERDEARIDAKKSKAYKRVLKVANANLKRERDKAREDLEDIKEYGTEEINDAVDLRQRLASALIERDDALSQIAQAECRAERFCQERDEARENLNEEMKSHHRTHIELIQTQCKLLDMEMQRDEAREFDGVL